MRVYLGGPIDERQSDESWKGMVKEWLSKSGHEAYDPEVFGLAAIRRGMPYDIIWNAANYARKSCDLAVYRYSPYSVGTHMEIDRSRAEMQEFFVWDLSPEEADKRVALWGVSSRTRLTLHTLIQSCVIPFLDREVPSRAVTLEEMWATTSTFLNPFPSLPSPMDTYLTR